MTDEVNLPDPLTVPEVAKLLRVTDSTVFTLIRAGKLPAFRVGRRFRISKSAYEAFINCTSTKGNEE